jgi:electron transfer flavoprotein alpha/beta subunit
VRRLTVAGGERYEAAPPLVLTVTNDERNVPRIPKTRDVMMSYRQTLASWTPADLGLPDAFTASRDDAAVVDLSVPVAEVTCEFVTGRTLDEKVEAFARRILNVVRAGS